MAYQQQTSPTAAADWKFSLFGCCDDFGLAASVYCCFPCNAGHVCSAAVDKTPYSMSCMGCLAALCFPGCTTCYLRKTIRETNHIPGSLVGDCFVSWCCAACTMCQMHREMTTRGVPPGSVCCASSTQPPPLAPAYPMAQGMPAGK